MLRLGAGAIAGIIAMSATYPLDMVRGRLTVQADGSPSACVPAARAAPLRIAAPRPRSRPAEAVRVCARRYRGIVHAAQTIAREEGMRAFYKGWLPSVIGVVPYVGLNFAVYETLKDMELKRRGLSDERDLGVVTRLTCGALAGSVGQTVAYPLDVVRRRLQVTGWSAGGAAAGGVVVALPPRYTGMVRTPIPHDTSIIS